MFRQPSFFWKPVMIAVVALALAPALAAADDFEIGLLLGYRLGGELESPGGDVEFDEDFAYGLLVGVPLRDGMQLELLWSRQETSIVAGEGIFGSPELVDLDVDYYHLGLLWEWGPSYPSRRFRPDHPDPDGIRLRPFFTVSAGLAEMNPARFPLDSESQLSASLGGGAKYLLGDFIGLRFEGRFFGTFLGGSREMFCAGERCLGTLSGSVLWQFQGSVGLVINF